MQDQDALSRCVVQTRPGQLDLLQFAENLVPEGLNGVVVAGFVWVRSPRSASASTSPARGHHRWEPSRLAALGYSPAFSRSMISEAEASGPTTASSMDLKIASIRL